MLSRVADAVFWMARYMERNDNVMRFLRTHYIASQDELLDFNWQHFADTLGTKDPEQQQEIKNYADALYYLILSRQHQASIFTNTLRARENARSVQDFITKELWQCLNDYYHNIRDPQTENLLTQGDPVTVLDQLLLQSVIYYGTVDITMNRGEGYSFLNLGKYIERALQALEALELKLQETKASPLESVQWKYLLYSLSGYEFHTKFYKNALQTEDVIHQVLYNVQFPHSVIYCLLQSERYFDRLDTVSLPEHFDELKFLLGKAVNDLRYSQVPGSDTGKVIELIHHTRLQIGTLNQKIGSLYFGYS